MHWLTQCFESLLIISYQCPSLCQFEIHDCYILLEINTQNCINNFYFVQFTENTFKPTSFILVELFLHNTTGWTQPNWTEKLRASRDFNPQPSSPILDQEIAA